MNIAVGAGTRSDSSGALADTTLPAVPYADIDKTHIWHPFTQMQDWVASDPLVIESGAGNWLIDTDGHRYLDGVSSLWCMVHGHRHPHIDAALHDQLDKISHSTLLGLTNTAIVEAAEALIEVVPAGLTRAFFSENGAAAVEVALKMAYQHWVLRGVEGRTKFVALDQAYHGDTLGAVSVGGIDEFHAAFGPLLFDALHAPTNLRGADGSYPDLLAEMEALLAAHADQTAAVIIEPLVQGAAGMITFPDGYVAGVRELCDRYGVLLIADEVATGFGRTGAMFACDLEGVTPDIMVVGKGITGGYLPMSATLTTEHIYESFLAETADMRHFFHGHTYSGNPLAAAACKANLEVFENEDTIANLAPKIDQMATRLGKIAGLDAVAEVRVRGLMAGIELVPAGDVHGRDLPGADVCLAARDDGVILRPLGPVVIWMPPLSITAGEIDLLADATEAAIASLSEPR